MTERAQGTETERITRRNKRAQRCRIRERWQPRGFGPPPKGLGGSVGLWVLPGVRRASPSPSGDPRTRTDTRAAATCKNRTRSWRAAWNNVKVAAVNLSHCGLLPPAIGLRRPRRPPSSSWAPSTPGLRVRSASLRSAQPRLRARLASPPRLQASASLRPRASRHPAGPPRPARPTGAALSVRFWLIFTRNLLKSRDRLALNAAESFACRQFPLDFRWLTFLDRHNLALARAVRIQVSPPLLIAPVPFTKGFCSHPLTLS